jgi:8-oxo-dGTP diphosphatase
MKKRGFGIGWWNGFGGKIHPGETNERAAIRELEEEAVVTASEKDLVYMGRILFYFKNKPDWNTEMYVYVLKKWQGEPQETDEMKPAWFSFKKIPYDLMWVSDTKWLPLVLAGKRVEGTFHFIRDGKGIEKFEIREVP